MTLALSAITGWALFASLILCSGALTGRWLLVPRLEEAERPTGLGTARALGRSGGILLTVSMALVLWRQVQEFRDPFAPFMEDLSLLLGATLWGRQWIAASLAALLVFVLFHSATRTRGGVWLAATAVVGALCTYPAFTGHANGTEGLRWLSLPADALHVMAAGAWIGGLTFILLTERAWRVRGESEGSLLPRLVPVFSPIAMVSVGILIVTGTFASWLHMVEVNELWTSAYGRTLSLKVGLVLAVLGLGALNWRRLTPRLGEDDGPGTLRRSATAELAIAQLVILVTALLVRTAPLHDWFWNTPAH